MIVLLTEIIFAFTRMERTYMAEFDVSYIFTQCLQSGFALDESSDISLCFSLYLLSVFLVSEVLGQTSVASFAHVN